MSDKHTSVVRPLIFGALFSVLLLVMQFSLLVSIGLGWSLFLFFLFFQRLGNSLPLLELMLLMAALQWVVGARFAYAYEATHYKYYMYVNESEYMRLAVPGTILFSLGVLFFLPKQLFGELNESIKIWLNSHPKSPYILIVIGFISVILMPNIPTSLRFIFYLTGSFQYAGLALLLFQKEDKGKWVYFGLIFGSLIITSILRGLFHDLFLWSSLMMSFVLLQYNRGWVLKGVIIFIGFFIAFLVQSVKAQYRAAAVNSDSEQRISEFLSLTYERMTNLNEMVEDEEVMEMINVRLNQGWIISAVINNISNNESYARGETIVTALKASLIPRIFYPDKKEAGGRENFRRFTGLSIREDTSMGTSILGESYANFGFQGAYIFMFIWGLVLAIGFRWLLSYAVKRPVMIVFLPLIFIQVIKAETEFVVVLNHFVKSIILVMGFLWFSQSFLGWKLSINAK